jgi:hypothetical protein
MPGKRSPEKLQARREWFARLPQQTQKDWLARSAIRKGTMEANERVKEKEMELKTVARSQNAREKAQEEEATRLNKWGSDLSQWHDKVNHDAQSDTVLKMKSIGARMCKMSHALTDSFTSSEAMNGEDVQLASQRIERLQQFSEGIYTEAYNMQHNTDLRVAPPVSGYQNRAERAHGVRWGEKGPCTYTYAPMQTGGRYSRMPPQDAEVPIGVRGGRPGTEERPREELNTWNPFVLDDVSQLWTDPRWS